MSPLLSVRSLSIAIRQAPGEGLPILSDVSFDLERGQTLGIVGESGSGKSLLALSLIGLLPASARLSGSIGFDGVELTSLAEGDFCKLRGRRIAMIFQEPMTALNPAMRIGDQIAEGLRLHGAAGRSEARGRALELLDRVRIADAKRRIDAFPHELSGGQRQRVVIAIALALSPDLLIADEPTTALDVTVQAEILDILAELVAGGRMSLILVSHDLGVIARATQRTLVMYAGTRFEEGGTEGVLHQPRNPYTMGLLAAMPRRRGAVPAGDGAGGRRRRLAVIPGAVPGFGSLPPGCRFADRCAFHIEACDASEPGWRVMEDGRGVRCIRAGEIGAGR